MYFVYLDESGDSRIREDAREEADFFVLGGLMIKEKDLLEYDKKFKEFKKIKLPPELWDYPVHAVELNQISKSKNSKYQNILSDEQGKAFLEEAYKLINTFPIEAIAVLIDTFELKRLYKKPKNPYFLSYEMLIEKVQKIVSKRNNQDNSIAMINLASCSTTLAKELKMIHNDFMSNGTRYRKLDNILRLLNIEENHKSSFYEIADLVCYAFRRSYYSWLCKHLNKKPINDNYLSLMKDICTLKIGHILINDHAHLKVFPDPRFLIKKEENTK